MENFRDDELKKWLAEEYEKETSEMEKALFPDGVIPDDGETEEEARAAYQELVKKLKADGVYIEDETDSNQADDHRENVKIVYLPEKKRHKVARVAAAVIVCAAGIFAASMTSQANRSYFIDSVRYWTGNDTSIVIDNDEKNEKELEDEQTAIDNIEEGLNVDIPLLLYRPKNFKFKSYNINAESGYALMEYYSGKEIVSLYINDYSDNRKSGAYILDGKEIATVKMKNEDINITIKKILDKNDIKENYAAYWEKNSVFYQISGKMEKKEFINLVKNIKF